MVERLQGLLGNIGSSLNNMSLPASLGLLSSGVSILEGNPISQSINTGLQTFGGLTQIEEDRKRREAIAKLNAKFPNDPIAQAFPEVFAKELLQQRFSEKSPKEPKTQKDIYGNLRYVSNPPSGKKVGDLVFDTNQDQQQTRFTKEDLSYALSLKDDLRQDLKTFEALKEGYDRIKEFTQGGGALDDYSLAVAYVKILDPTSVARETEVEAVIQNSASVPSSLRASLLNAVKGEGALPPLVREEILKNSKGLYERQAKRSQKILKRYEEAANAQAPNLFSRVYLGEPITFDDGTVFSSGQSNQSFKSTLLNKTFQNKIDLENALDLETEKAQKIQDIDKRTKRLLEIANEARRLGIF